MGVLSHDLSNPLDTILTTSPKRIRQPNMHASTPESRNSISNLAIGDRSRFPLATRQAGLVLVRACQEISAPLLHTEKLVLVDGSGHLRGVYNGTQPFAVDQLISDLRQLNASQTASNGRQPCASSPCAP